MKLSLVFELLLLFVLLAFAASKNIDRQRTNKKGVQKQNDGIQIEDNSINKYCKCSEALCNCCRDFSVPLINLNGPGCASLMYINGDKMSVSLRFGNKVITNRTLSSRKPSPVCMPLPGGISKFCGRVYNIARVGEEFRACLGLELQAKKAVEAAVRVSCFKFGSRGVISEPADPLPLVPQGEKDTDDDNEDDDDDDDEDVDFGLDTDDDDDDDDAEDDDDEDDDEDGGIDAVNGVESADYTGFSLLGEDLLGDLFGGSTSSKKGNKNKNKKKQASIIVSTTTTKSPRPSRRPTVRPVRRTTTVRPTTTRTTTVKVRPVNRRPTRRPLKRPTRRFTTAPSTKVEETSNTSPMTSTLSPVSIADMMPNGPSKEYTEIFQKGEVHQVIPITEPPLASSEPTSPTVTSFEDPGLEISLAHITDQLSLMPVTQLVLTEEVKGTSEKAPSGDEVSYEKIQTITSKPHSTIPFATVVNDDDKEEMVQIVQSLDSNSEEHAADSENVIEDNRSHKHNQPIPHYEGLSLPKKKHRGIGFNDLDVLDLTGIGESFGQQLGIFGGGRHKRQNKHKENKPNNIKGVSDYEDILGLDALSESLQSFPDIDDLSRKGQRRQNKMMRGIWPVA